MTSYATLRDNTNTPEDGLASINAALAASSLELASSADNLANDECIKKITTPSTPGYDPDSFSESEREKMDSTPENIKKIDDVIDDNGHHHQDHSARTVQQTHHHYNTTYNNTPPYLSPRSEQTSNFGLAAAVDDSNAKYCLAKPLCNIPKGKNKNNIFNFSLLLSCVTNTHNIIKNCFFFRQFVVFEFFFPIGYFKC